MSWIYQRSHCEIGYSRNKMHTPYKKKQASQIFYFKKNGEEGMNSPIMTFGVEKCEFSIVCTIFRIPNLSTQNWSLRISKISSIEIKLCITSLGWGAYNFWNRQIHQSILQDIMKQNSTINYMAEGRTSATSLHELTLYMFTQVNLINPSRVYFLSTMCPHCD